jgi:hypothetical protein
VSSVAIPANGDRSKPNKIGSDFARNRPIDFTKYNFI